MGQKWKREIKWTKEDAEIQNNIGNPEEPNAWVVRDKVTIPRIPHDRDIIPTFDLDTQEMSQQEQKTDARDARLSSIRKTQEEVLRKNLQQVARDHCVEESAAFGSCAKENGMWVIFKCRDQNKTRKSTDDLNNYII